MTPPLNGERQMRWDLQPEAVMQWPMNPLVAVLLGGFAGLMGTAFMELRYGNAIAPNAGNDANAAPPRAEQVGFILGALATTNILLGGILGVLLFQAMR